jgi:hypothetical protein
VEEPKDSTKTADAPVPKAKGSRKLDEAQKKALELADRAEHAIGQKRERLQKAARRMAEDG